MSELVPAEAPGTDLDRVARLGMWLAASEAASKARTEDPKALGMAAAFRIETARAMGLPPWAAADLHFIDGKVSLSARLKRAAAPAHGLRVTRKAEGPDFCTAAVVVIATGEELGDYTFTLDMAKREGLLDKKGPNWQRIPERMLWARASSRVIDDFAPWVTMGFQTDQFATVTEAMLNAEGDDPGEPFEVIEQ